MTREALGETGREPPVYRPTVLEPYRRDCHHAGPKIISSCSRQRSFQRFAESRSIGDD